LRFRARLRSRALLASRRRRFGRVARLSHDHCKRSFRFTLRFDCGGNGRLASGALLLKRPDVCIERLRLFLELQPLLPKLFEPLACLADSLLRIAQAPPPFGVLASSGRMPLPRCGSLARGCRRFRPFVGNSGAGLGCAPTGLLDFRLQRLRVWQGG